MLCPLLLRCRSVKLIKTGCPRCKAKPQSLHPTVETEVQGDDGEEEGGREAGNRGKLMERKEKYKRKWNGQRRNKREEQGWGPSQDTRTHVGHGK